MKGVLLVGLVAYVSYWIGYHFGKEDCKTEPSKKKRDSKKPKFYTGYSHLKGD